MLRTAVIGLGNIGKTHTRYYSQNKDAQLVALCDMLAERGCRDAAIGKLTKGQFYVTCPDESLSSLIQVRLCFSSHGEPNSEQTLEKAVRSIWNASEVAQA